jgi:hypothetical protein
LRQHPNGAMVGGHSPALTLHPPAIALSLLAVILSIPSKRSPPPRVEEEDRNPEGLPRRPAEPGLLTMLNQPATPIPSYASS